MTSVNFLRTVAMHPATTAPLSFLLACWVAASSFSDDNTDKRSDFFETRIRPVLVEHCYECHNSDGSSEGELAVDSREVLIRGGTNGNLIVPGKPQESLLIKILQHEIPGLEMPEGGEQLDKDIIQDFTQWITDGAFDPRDQPPSAEDLSSVTSWDAVRQRRQQWWSFQPIASPSLPTVVNSGAHPIDLFVNARLAQEQLDPSPIASTQSIIRRLYFNLIGLPPSSAELRSWTSRIDQSNGSSTGEGSVSIAISELVDTLLSDPRFGERWARHWMDWIRYAESHGSEGDPAIDKAWRYRDYLIRALNQDVAINKLIVEHIAGDLIADPRRDSLSGFNESIVGTAHWRMVFHGFAPTDPLDERVRFTDDQINVFTKGFLGLTVSCARCHDHKFDPISQEDYYAIFGILTSCRPGRNVVNNSAKQDEILQRLAAIKRLIKQELGQAWIAQLDSTSNPVAPAKEAVVADLPLHSDTKCKSLWDFSVPGTIDDWLAYGDGLSNSCRPPGDFVVSNAGDEFLSELFPASVVANALSTKQAARFSSPDIQLEKDSQLELWVLARGAGSASVRYVVEDYPRDGTVYPVRKLTDNWKWHRFDLSYWSGNSVHFEFATAQDAPLLTASDDRSWFAVRQVALIPKGTEIKYDHQAFQPVSPVKLNDQQPDASHSEQISLIKQAISCWQQDILTDQQVFSINDAIKSGLLIGRMNGSQTLGSLVNEYRQLEAQLETPIRVPGLEETPGKDSPLFVRGNHHQQGPIVPRRFLEVFDATPYATESSGRLQLAESIVDPQNPLTSRVIANRIWHHLFGQGLVQTTDNFGRVGDLPSHPELLDWLAIRLQQSDWSLKSLIREVVTSETWLRSAKPSADALTRDPTNRLLSHANVRRLEAEPIRDTMLAVSGQLQMQFGGEPVIGSANRRSVYVRVIRNSLDPILRTFDFPEPFSTVGRRDVTNVPAQSLTLANDPYIVNLAKSWAMKVTSNSKLLSDRDRINHMLLDALQRQSSPEEVSLIEKYLNAARNRFDDESVTRDATKDPVANQSSNEIAAWSEVAHLLFTLKEFIYVQ